GVKDGIGAVVHTIAHPITTMQNAGSSLRSASSFLAGLVCDVMRFQIALEQHCDGQFIGIEIDYPSQECDQMIEKFSMISKACKTIYQEGCKKTGPERVRLITALGTEFIVSGKVYGVLARSAGSLYAHAGSQLKTLI